MKKLFFLSAFFILLLHQPVLANYTTSDGFKWSIAISGDKKFVYIDGYTGKETNLTIPAYIEGMPVDTIYMFAFWDNKNLVSVTLPPTLESIQEFAFSGCTNLRSINIPESVTYIGDSAFGGCTSLKEIVIPKSVSIISSGAFPNTITIHGYYGTAAEAYAEYRCAFIGTSNNLAEVAAFARKYIEDVYYNGSPFKQEVVLYYTFPYFSSDLVEGVDYTVSYRNNVDPGIATIVATGINHYYGSITTTFNIYQYPIKAKPTSVKAKAKKNKVTVSWKRSGSSSQLSDIKSIQVQYDTDRTFMHPKSKKVSRYGSRTVLTLPKKKQTWYIRVRYKGWAGVSKWSSVKKIKVK